MKKKSFIIDEVTLLYISTRHETIEKLSFMSELFVYLVDKGKKVKIGDCFASDFVNAFVGLLQRTINKDLIFNDEAYSSPGVLFNKWAAPARFASADSDEGDGIKYILSHFNKKRGRSIRSYLYNNKEGNIIFEIGEVFEWLDEENVNKNQLLIEDKEFAVFLETYLPLYKRIIPVNIAKKWLKNARSLQKLLLYNETDGCPSGENLFKDGSA